MDIYKELGIKTYINAWDTMSLVGGSRMRAETFARMREASRDFVELKELQQKVGQKIAEMTRNEAAFVTGGASAGILLSCAAAMAGGLNEQRLEQLPDTAQMKNEIVVMKGHRNPYDFAVRVSGATLVAAGEELSCTKEQLMAAINENTAAVLYFQTHYFDERGVPLEDVVKIAHEKGAYVIVDGAAQLPPKENLWRFTKDLGADIALFSGGKGLRGPQQGGLVVGSKKLIDAIAYIAPPKQGLGRSSKAGREEIIGVYTALKAFLADGYVEGLQAHLKEASQRIIAELEETGLFTCEVTVPGPTGQSYDWVKAGIKGERFDAKILQERLKADEAGVLVGAREGAITVNPLNLEPEEIPIVIEQIIKHANALCGGK